MSARRHGLDALAAYGVLGLPLAALGLPLVVYLPPFYAQMAALNTGLVGVIIFVARLVDVISDPIVGTASDRMSSRFGRRRPWIAAGIPLLMLSAWFLFMPGHDVGALYLLLWSILAYIGWTLIYLPFTTMGAELSEDYDERSRITAWREGFLVLGTLIAIMLPAAAQQWIGGRGVGLEAIAIFLFVALPLCGGLFLWRVPERAGNQPSVIPWSHSWRLLAGNAPFRRLVLAYLLNGAANGLPAALFLFFVTAILGADETTAGIFLMIYFLSAVAGLPIWLWIGRRWSKHRLWCVSMLWVSAVFVFSLTLGRGDYAGYIAICVLGGSGLGVDQSMAASIQADVIDEDTAAGGDGRAGLYFGLWGMATKLALAIALGIAYPLLWLSGFDSAGNNDGAAVWTLALLYGLLPVAVKLGVVALMWRFPLDRGRHAELQARIGGVQDAEAGSSV